MQFKSVPAALVAFSLSLSAATARADIVIEQPWARATVPGATVAAGYLTIRNTGTEQRTLLRLTSPATDRLMIHRSSIDAQGVAHMWPVAKLELGPGETLKFEPNGLHLMFMAIEMPFRAGDRVPVTFQFEGEDPVTVQLEVRPLTDPGPGTAGAMHHH